MTPFMDLEHCHNSYDLLKMANERNMKEKHDLEAQLHTAKGLLKNQEEYIQKYQRTNARLEKEIGTYLNRLQILTEAAQKLRSAQKAYMANRGNEELGKAVASAAAELDSLLPEQQ